MADAVVITRPWQQAEELADKVRAAGRAAIVFPLLDIYPLADPQPLKEVLARLESFALVAFVSPNAIGAALAARADWPKQVPLAVMGEGSRRALAAHGISEATTTIHAPKSSEKTDSETLLATLDLQSLRGKEVLILRGESGRELLADALRAAGVNVTQAAAYRRVAPQFDQARRAHLRELLSEHHLWHITSSEALRYLARMAGQLFGEEEGAERLKRQTLLIPHIRIAETAQDLGLSNIVRCGSGDEHMLAALQSCP